MLSRRYLLIILLIVQLIVNLVEAQDDTNNVIQIETTILQEISGDQYSYEKAILSPNGNHIAWVESLELCLLDLTSEQTECYEWEWDDNYMFAFRGHEGMYFTWSPDSTKIALAKSPFRLGYDSDVWIFELDNRQFMNITDDGYYGVLPVGESQIPVDIMPTWSNNSQTLYLFRTYSDAAETPQFFSGLEILEYDLNQQEINLVMEMPPQFSAFVGSASISPDGSKLAVFVTPSSDNDVLNGGIWIVNIVEETIEPLVLLDDFFIGSIEWLQPQAFYMSSNQSILWSLDGERLYVGGTWRYEGDLYLSNFYSIDTNEPHTILPLVDLSSFPIPESTSNVEDFMINVASVAFISDQDDIIYFLTGIGDSRVLNYASLSMFSNTETSIDNMEYAQSHRGGLYRVLNNGLVLLDGLTLITITDNN